MKTLLAFAVILLLALPAFGVTNTTVATGNLSDGTKWSQGYMPVNGEDVVFAHNITWDAGAGTRFPATGTLGAASSTAGTLTVAVSTIGSCGIYAASIAAGTAHCITATGSTANTFTASGATITGGTATSIYAINGGNCVYVFIGLLTGGPGSGAYGAYIPNGTRSVTVTGNVAAGGLRLNNYSPGSVIVNGTSTGGAAGDGVYLNGNINGCTLTFTGGLFGGVSSTNTTTFGLKVNQIAGNTYSLICPALTNSATAVALGGAPPATWTNYNGANEDAKTITMVNSGRSNVWVTQPLDHQVLSGVVIGDLTGNRVDATAASVISSHSYGDPAAQTAGTYHPTTVAEVLDTVSFGAVSAETGTYHEAATTEVEDGIFFGPGSTYEGSFAGGGGATFEAGFNRGIN